MYYQLTKSSYRDSLKILEADIEHANGLWVILWFFLGSLIFTGFRVFSIDCYSWLRWFRV